MATTTPASDAAKTGKMIRSPYRIGQLQDWGMGVQVIRDQFDATIMAFEEAQARGVIDRPVEIITRAVEGLPFNSHQLVPRAYQELIDEGCLIVLGPQTSEALIGMVHLPQELKMPTLTYAVTHQFAGDYCFTLQNGSFGDEAALMVGYLAKQGVKKLGVIYEENLIGEDYWRYFKIHARDAGVHIHAIKTLGMFFEPEVAMSTLASLREAGVDSVAYMGNGFPAKHVMDAMAKMVAGGWNPVRVTSSIFMAATPGLGYGMTPDNFEGWAGIEQWHEENTVFNAMLDRFEKRFGRRAPHCFTAMGYDMGATVAQAISMARPVCPAGMRTAMEQVRGLRATLGGPGTTISFGPHAHRGYNGQYILMRKYVNGKNVLA